VLSKFPRALDSKTELLHRTPLAATEIKEIPSGEPQYSEIPEQAARWACRRDPSTPAIDQSSSALHVHVGGNLE